MSDWYSRAREEDGRTDDEVFRSLPRKEAVRCSKQIDGPKINGAGTVAWRRECKNRTRNRTGRCRFHPTRFDGVIECYPGESAETHRTRHA